MNIHTTIPTPLSQQIDGRDIVSASYIPSPLTFTCSHCKTVVTELRRHKRKVGSICAACRNNTNHGLELACTRCGSTYPADTGFYLNRTVCKVCVRVDSARNARARGIGGKREARRAEKLRTGYVARDKTPEYNTWKCMKSRCHNPNNP